MQIEEKIGIAFGLVGIQNGIKDKHFSFWEQVAKKSAFTHLPCA
jgi:hypothetical protein